MEEKETEAAKDYEIAERHLRQAEGNQFFCYRLFRESRIQFYQSVGRLELRDNERELLKQYEETEKRLDLEESLKCWNMSAWVRTKAQRFRCIRSMT